MVPVALVAEPDTSRYDGAASVTRHPNPSVAVSASVYYWRRVFFGGWRETFHNYYFSTSFFWYPDLTRFQPIHVPVNKSAEARRFAGQYSLDDGRIDPDVALGSQQAKNFSRILEDMLGVEFFDGKLEQTCTGTLAYDTDSTIPCDSPTLLGRILLGLIDTIIPPARSQEVTPVFTQLPEPSPGLYGYGSDFPPENGGGTYRRGQYGTTGMFESVTSASVGRKSTRTGHRSASETSVSREARNGPDGTTITWTVRMSTSDRCARMGPRNGWITLKPYMIGKRPRSC